MKFKAVLTGDPDPEVIWFVNGIPLTESEKIKFISEDGICIVTIKDVSRHFDGMVTCQVGPQETALERKGKPAYFKGQDFIDENGGSFDTCHLKYSSLPRGHWNELIY